MIIIMAFYALLLVLNGIGCGVAVYSFFSLFYAESVDMIVIGAVASLAAAAFLAKLDQESRGMDKFFDRLDKELFHSIGFKERFLLYSLLMYKLVVRFVSILSSFVLGVLTLGITFVILICSGGKIHLIGSFYDLSKLMMRIYEIITSVLDIVVDIIIKIECWLLKIRTQYD